MKRLWIGGSSGLARTYLNAYGDLEDESWILLGHESKAPFPLPNNVVYYQHDLTEHATDSLMLLLLEKLKDVEQIVIGIRPPLLSKMTNEEMTQYCSRLLQGLDSLLRAILAVGQHQQEQQHQSILHISSVAAANHLQAQHFQTMNDKQQQKQQQQSADLLIAPYDRFKRACEELVDGIAASSLSCKMATSLRLSAIFSDDPNCIQCNALALQSRIGPYLPQCIDCNSSANVAAAIRLLLAKQQEKEATAATAALLASYYYYTRPLKYIQRPIPYGEYLAMYRQANDIQFHVWIPVVVVRWLVQAIHWMAARRRFIKLPYLDSVDYLLQVSYRDHSFDCSDFVRDVPDIVLYEETIVECFRRRRKTKSSFVT